MLFILVSVKFANSYIYTYIHTHHYSPNQLLVIKLNVIQVNTIMPMITVAPDQLQTSKWNGNINSQPQSQLYGNILNVLAHLPK